MNQRSNNLKKLALILAVVLVVVAIYWQGARAWQLGGSSLTAFSSGSTSTVTISADRLVELEALRQENQRLRQELNSATTTVASSSLAATTSYQSVAVIGRPPQSPYDTIIIDHGTADGVTLGQPVWWPAGVYLGEVIEASSRSAVVELVSSAGVTHTGKVGGVPVETEGYGGDGLYAEIPRAVSVAVGDVIISDRYELPIGVIVDIEELNARNVQALYISRFAASPSLETVYVSDE